MIARETVEQFRITSLDLQMSSYGWTPETMRNFNHNWESGHTPVSTSILEISWSRSRVVTRNRSPASGGSASKEDEFKTLNYTASGIWIISSHIHVEKFPGGSATWEQVLPSWYISSGKYTGLASVVSGLCFGYALTLQNMKVIAGIVLSQGMRVREYIACRIIPYPRDRAVFWTIGTQILLKHYNRSFLWWLFSSLLFRES